MAEWLRAVIAFGSGVAGLSVLFPPSHSTHVFHSSPSRTHPWSVHSHHDFGFVFSSRTGFGAFLVSRRFSSSPPRVAEHPRTANCVLPVVCASTDKNGAVFPHAGPPLSVLFLAGSDCLPTHKHSSIWGAHSELRAVLLHP